MAECMVVGCGGDVSKIPENEVRIQTSCWGTSPAYPCSKCGRLHTDSDGVFFSRGGAPVYFLGDTLENKEETHYMVYLFKSDAAALKKDRQKGLFVKEIVRIEDLAAAQKEMGVRDGLMHAWNPVTRRWAK